MHMHSANSSAPTETSLVVARPTGSSSISSTRRKTVRALAAESGQGTVEYVGLLLLMATVLAAVVGLGSQLGGKEQIGEKVVTQVGKSIDKAGSGK